MGGLRGNTSKPRKAKEPPAGKAKGAPPGKPKGPPPGKAKGAPPGKPKGPPPGKPKGAPPAGKPTPARGPAVEPTAEYDYGKPTGFVGAARGLWGAADSDSDDGTPAFAPHTSAPCDVHTVGMSARVRMCYR